MTQNWGGVADSPEGYAAIHRDLGRLERWAHKTFMKFIMERSRILTLGRNNPRHQDMLGATQLESVRNISIIFSDRVFCEAILFAIGMAGVLQIGAHSKSVS